MSNLEAVLAVMALVGFLGGVMVGVIVIVSAAFRHEDKRYSLTGKAPGPACEGARWLTGVGVRGDDYLSALRGGAAAGIRTIQGQDQDQ